MWLGLLESHPNAKFCYLAGRWGLLPKLLQQSFVSLDYNWGLFKFLPDVFEEPPEGKHLAYTDIVWGLRNCYKGLCPTAIKALAMHTREFMHHEVFELVSAQTYED